MTTKHTPGPWTIGYGRSYQNRGIFDGGEVDSYGNQNVRLINGLETRIACMEEAETWRPQKTVNADARLIASAPELLEALRGLYAFCLNNIADMSEANGHTGSVQMKAARCALGQAEGGEG